MEGVTPSSPPVSGSASRFDAEQAPSETAPAVPTLLPPHAPRAMKARALAQPRAPERENPDRFRVALSSILRRAAVFSLSAGSIGLLAWFGTGLLAADGGLTGLEAASIVAFVLCLSPIVVSFWISMAGFCCLCAGAGRPGLRSPAGHPAELSRTALILTLYNDDAQDRFASLEAMMRDLATQPAGPDLYEVFVLSDTRCVEKAKLEADLAQRLHGAVPGIPIWYRRRAENTGHKSGNLADFCRRWGARYDYMLVLDADSFMAGHTIRNMVGLMDANRDAGLIQAPVRARRTETAFGVLQGFAMSVYGPVFEQGAAFINLGDGNYFGHNAIIRVDAFAESAGLPELPGRAPRGGLILSHDFVEAAFMRRAGWRIWMAPELTGSFEECPPNLIAFAKRDRRWCQGNLQHLRILPARGLHPMSRFHLGWGVLAYAGALLWLVFLLLGGAVIAERELGVHNYFGADRQLFPIWPVFDLEQATLLLIATGTLLLLPRTLALLHHLAVSGAWSSPAKAVSAVGLFLAEVCHSTMTAPILMICHLRFLFAFAIGRAVTWSPKESEDGSLSPAACLSAFSAHMLIGVTLAVLIGIGAPQLLGWTAPIWASLMVAPLVAWASARTLPARRPLRRAPAEAAISV